MAHCRLLRPARSHPLVDTRVGCSLPCFFGTPDASAQGLPRTDFQGGRTRGSRYCLGFWFSEAYRPEKAVQVSCSPGQSKCRPYFPGENQVIDLWPLFIPGERIRPLSPGWGSPGGHCLRMTSVGFSPLLSTLAWSLSSRLRAEPAASMEGGGPREPPVASLWIRGSRPSPEPLEALMASPRPTSKFRVTCLPWRFAWCTNRKGGQSSHAPSARAQVCPR